MPSRGIGGHQSAAAASVEWLTPPEWVQQLGPFDLDPCSPRPPRPWNTARFHIDQDADGLDAEWFGRVWCNPPYGRHVGRWVRKLREHGNGIALLFARTETAHFQEEVFPHADAILFVRGRPRFRRPDGTPGPHTCGGPIALIAYGIDNATKLETCDISGAVVKRNKM